MINWIQKFFNSSKIEGKADIFVQIFCRQVPLSVIKKQTAVKKGFAIVLAQAKGEKRKFEWSASVTARISNAFGWKLIEKGYPKDLALVLAKDMAIELAQDVVKQRTS